jgi:hypothetical protein
MIDRPVHKLGKQKSHVIYRTKDKRRVPGASTIASIGEDKSGLIHAAWKLGTEGVNYRAQWDAAAEVGTCAHFLIEAHLKGWASDLSEFSPDVVDLAENVFLKFLEYWEQEGMTLIASEKELVSELGYGGTIDVIARDKEGRLVIVDEKSSKAIFDPHIIQLSAYEQLWNENNAEKITRRAIFRNGKKEKGDTELRWLPPLDRHFDHFKIQLALYNSKKRL